jgi:hypothetical protein
MKKPTSKPRIVLELSSKLKDIFRRDCKKNGTKMATELRWFIKNYVAKESIFSFRRNKITK